MAMPQALKSNNKKTVVFFLQLIHRLHPTKSSLATNILQEQSQHASASVNNISPEDLRTLCKQSRLRDAMGILRVMDHRGVWPDISTYASLLQECVIATALPEAKLIHAHIILTGFKPDISLDTKVVNLYAKCGSLVDARRVLDEMPERDLVSWTAMIAGYAQNGFAHEALSLFYQMQRIGIQPNEYTFASVLPVLANSAALEHGKEVHEDIIRGGFESSVFVASALVDMYAKCGSIKYACKVFDKMPERNVVSWNAMITGFAQNGHFDEALKVFYQMQLTGVKPNCSTFASVLPACANGAAIQQGKELHEDIIRSGYLSNVFVSSALVDMYAKCGSIGNARQVFDNMHERTVVSWTGMIAGYAQNGYVDEALNLFREMPERNVAAWNAMVAGYVQNGQYDEALKLFGQMQLTGFKPNQVTFASVLPACANLALLQQGRFVHEDIIRSGFQSNIFVENALVDMYAKCGSIKDGRKVFDEMPEQNVVSWNAMIGGYAMHGYGKEALQLFEQMQHCNLRPDHVTFLGVLSACCHAGLVADGWKYYECMSRDYHITPEVEHYCCMVDLLGRAGHVDEAHDFINKMPGKPHAKVWGSLLGACRIHANIEIGERVAECLFETDPENSSHYVLLSNIYASAGRWDDKEKVRTMMKEKGLKKMPGCSWIEVNNKVHAFLVGDRSHPRTQEIYAMLEILSGQMKGAGYVPETNLVLHDVENEQKEHIIGHHSEKLAIAFALISTSPGTSIRIVKNLRVCIDCHSATKFISKIVAREIVMRDANRFHHFKDGFCSCGDYW
eukprot:Gb_07756 [translate_table: standard]